ncbi:hypothetical protein KBB96_04980 [Luteolibacter ambystomatis]|uniref:Penicillin-binding protein transpeptidase domain-containing protein n=1 Tax=Luteolibacter ambystomatis TaxID=2824561 RepID=A0A975J1D8_9BACT|nr:penicillin-binding transpeptidase domain-containing protein [Luteolibacter ambystomatis]QUE52246.1 hypothetical protein KBB96_04980 [Luteolibacter ambystomatis]
MNGDGVKSGVEGQRFIVVRGGPLRGDEALSAAKFPIASLFKVVIAYAALESDKITLDEAVSCPDALPKAGKTEFTLSEAMLHSSNDFFKLLLNRLTPDELRLAIDELRFPSLPSIDQSIEEEWADLWRGGNIQASPQEVFLFTRGLGELARLSSKEAFISCLRRSEADLAGGVYGKTGTWGGAAWCTGFSLDPVSNALPDVVTVLVTYTVPHWQDAHARAMQLFHEELKSSLG